MKNVTALFIVMLIAGSAMAMNEIVVSELMYNSIGTDVEWIEMINHSESAVDLTGWYVTDDNETHTPMFLSGVMAPGEVMVLAGDEDLFTTQYPGVTNFFPVFFQTNPDGTWALGNGGDGVRIFNGAGELVYTMDYDDGGDWPGEADGDGPSLLLVNSGASDFADPAAWMAGPEWGTPGYIEGTVATVDATMGQIKSLYR